MDSGALEELAWYMTHVNDGVRDMSPCERVFVTQIALEPQLCRRAEELGADIRFQAELVEFAQDADGLHTSQQRALSGN